jgi:hypothetical protein
VAVRLHREEVFPPGPDGRLPWLYRLANAIHVTTRPFVIRNEIVLRVGDPADSLRLAESVRLLRARSLFEVVEGWYEAADTGWVAHIRTRDYWTLNVQAGYERQGGIQSLLLGVLDANLLGTGNVLSFSQRWSNDRDQTRWSFVAPRFLGRRETVSLEYRDNSDGLVRAAGWSHAYENPLQPWSYGVVGYRMRGRHRMFHEDEETVRIPLEEDRLEAHVAHYPGTRIQVGGGAGLLVFDFRPRGVWVREGAQAPEPVRPERLRMAYLVLGIQQRRFLQTRNLDRYEVVEDYPLGFAGQVVLGRNVTAWGAPDRRYHLGGTFTASARGGGGLWGSLGLEGSHQREGDRPGITRLRGRLLLFRRHSLRTLTALQVSGRRAWRVPAEERIYLGGATGLRGYPARELDGTEYLLVNLEHRHWTRHRLEFFGLGWTLFADVGWVAGPEGSLARARPHPSAGIGLLVGNPKSGAGVLRVEAAWRLDGRRGWDLGVSMSRLLALVPEVGLRPPLLDVFDHRP